MFGGVRSATLIWDNAQPGEIRQLFIRAPRTPDGPPRIRLSNLQTGRAGYIGPLERDDWRQWRPTGLDRIEFFWAGTAGLSDLEVDWLLQRETEAAGQPAAPAHEAPRGG